MWPQLAAMCFLGGNWAGRSCDLRYELIAPHSRWWLIFLKAGDDTPAISLPLRESVPSSFKIKLMIGIKSLPFEASEAKTSVCFNISLSKAQLHSMQLSATIDQCSLKTLELL